MGEIVASVKQRHLERLGTSIGKTIAEIEIGGVPNNLAIGRSRRESIPADLGGNGHFFGAEILDKCIGRGLGLPQQFGSWPYSGLFSARATAASNLTSGEI